MAILIFQDAARRGMIRACICVTAIGGASLWHCGASLAQGGPANPPAASAAPSGGTSAILPAAGESAPQTRSAPSGIPADPQTPQGSAFPQPSGQSTTAPAVPQAGTAPSQPKPEGFFDAIGRWFDKSSADFRAGVEENNARWRVMNEQSKKAAQDAAAASREAAEAFRNLSKIRMVEGRKVCDLAPNGSPDCQKAAEDLCKGKGYSTGKSADIQSSQRCSARALLDRDPGGCRTETIVVKAACQ